MLALAAGVVLLFDADICFRRIDQLMRVDAHPDATRVDRHQPLRGRWLGILLVVILFPLGMLAVLVGGMVLVGGLIGLIGLFVGPR